VVGTVVAAACPAVAVADAGVLGGAPPAEDRVLDVGAAVVEPAVGVDDGVGLRVRVCVTVAVAAGLEVREAEEVVTVTVVGSLVGCVPGEVFPPRIDSPVPPDSRPPLTVSTSVTVARLAAKTTTAAAAAASTTISGRRGRRATGVAERPALGITTVGSS
jgi:hypothetical protein